jgi:hypothetical protein
MKAVLLALNLISLPGAHGSVVYVNPQSVVSLRAASATGHYASDIRCLIQTSDGKVVGSTDPCPEVTMKLGIGLPCTLVCGSERP